MSISDLELAALFLSARSREQHQQLYDIFDSFPSGDNDNEIDEIDDEPTEFKKNKLVTNFREKLHKINKIDTITNVVTDSSGNYSAILELPELYCGEFIRNVSVGVISSHKLNFEMPVELNSISLGRSYHSSDGRYFRLDSQWFTSDFYEYEDDMSDNEAEDDTQREEKCKYLNLFTELPVKISMIDGGPIELPIIVKYSWEAVFMLHQVYGINHFKKSNKIVWEGDRWTNQLTS